MPESPRYSWDLHEDTIQTLAEAWRALNGSAKRSLSPRLRAAPFSAMPLSAGLACPYCRQNPCACFPDRARFEGG